MSQVRRIWLGIRITGLMAVAAIMHFRLGVDNLYPLATQTFAGPFSHVVVTLESIVPITIAGILFVTWLWVFVAPAQEERARRRVGPPR